MENILPSSPDLLLSVPETPNCQIKLSSSRGEDQLSQEPCREAACKAAVCLLSPISRSPSAKGLKLQKMTENGRKNKRENRLSGPLKRLFCPPEESHTAKRVRSSPKIVINSTEVSLKGERPLADPVRTPQLNSDQSESLTGKSGGTTVNLTKGKNSVISPPSVSDHLVGEQRKQEEEESAKSDFTVITELKADETKASRNLQRCLDEDTSTVGACAQPATGKLQQEDVLKVKQSTRTLETDGDADNRTSSGQEQTTGIPCHLKYIFLSFEC